MLIVEPNCSSETKTFGDANVFSRVVSPEVGGDTEDHYEHGVVDIEAISNKGENTH